MKKYLKFYFYKLAFLTLIRMFRKLTTLKKVLLFIGIFLLILIFLVIIYYTNFFVELIYYPELEKSFNRNTLFFFIIIPLLLVLISFIVLVRVFFAFLKRKSLQQLRFKFMGFFFIAVFIPATFYIILFDKSFDSFINIVDNQAVVKSLEVKLWNLRLAIREEQEKLERESIFRIENNFFSLENYDQASIFVNYNKKFQPIILLKKENIRNIPKVNFNRFLLKNENLFSSYDEKKGFIFNLYHYPNLENPYFLAIHFVAPDVRDNIQETLKLINEVKQFQETLPAFKNVVFFIFFYIFIQLFSLTLIFFYYRFSKYFSPIDKLSKSTIELSKGDFNPPYLAELRRIEYNEFKDLIKAFYSLVVELRSNRRRLKRLSKIEAWREVVQKLAHEIKNPLTPIKLATNQIEESLIKQDIEAYKKMGKNFNFIYSEITRIENLIKDISLYPKFSLNRKTTLLKIVLRKIDNYLANYPSIHYERKFEGVENLALLMDSEKIYQAILNLVKNALESLQKVRNDKKIIISAQIKKWENNQSFLEIKIKDNGKGIGFKKKEDVFKPYVTSKKSGTGLGLSISEEIIHLHQGKIDIENEKGWTVFIIWLHL